jgi:hypothetical protein
MPRRPHYVVHAGIYNEETGTRHGGFLPYACLTRAWAGRLASREIDEYCADFADVFRVGPNGDRTLDRLPFIADPEGPF